jgi:aryl-alcohol dehydrogenase-like predicted oxidoreductase
MPRYPDARISRRCALQSVAAAGISSTLIRPLAAAATLPLITKAIPATGEKLPVIGIGTNSFRNAKFDELRAVLGRMNEMGGTVIDTAAMYGESEGVIGKALAELGLGNKMFLATKFNAPGMGLGPPPGPQPGMPAGGGGPGGPGGPPRGAGSPIEQLSAAASFERSMERLKRIDLMMIHQLSSVEVLMSTLVDYKRAGRVRYIGITTAMPQGHPQLIEYMKKYPVDFVQVDYSLANRDAASTVFPVAAERKIAVMVAVPLGGRRGSLISEAATRQLPAWAADFDASSWSQFFLKYVVSHPAVTCAIPGSTKVTHTEDNQGAGHGRLPNAAQRKRMEEFWDGKA